MDSLDTINISQIVTVSLTLFAVIDILGSIPILVSLKKKMGIIKKSAKHAVRENSALANGR